MPTGILLVDKQKEWTSHDVVAVMRTALGATKLGHAGTLDPAATGLLVLLIGREATKYQDGLQKGGKIYNACVTLGIETDMWDLDVQSTILRKEEVPDFTFGQIKEQLNTLVGNIEQIIPSYSAIKVKGRAMYKMARKGMEIETKIKPTTVYSISNISYQKPEIKFTASCAGGTYIRSLAHMLGQKLGCPSVLSGLRRIEANGFKVEDSLSIDVLRHMPRADIEKRILPVPQNFKEPL